MKNAIKKFYANFEEIVGSIVLIIMCIVAVLQVASRYIFGDQFSWTEETCTFLFVWLFFTGSALALKTSDHFAVDIIVEKLPLKASKAVRLLALVFVLTFTAILIWFGIRMTTAGAHSITPALEIPKSIPYAAVPAGGLLMAVRTIETGLRMLRTSSNTQENQAKKHD